MQDEMCCNRGEPVPRAICDPVQLLGHKSQGSMLNKADIVSTEVEDAV